MIRKPDRRSVLRAITFDDVSGYSGNAPHNQQGLLRSVGDARDNAALSAQIPDGKEFVQNHGDGEMTRWEEYVRGLDLMDRYVPALAVELGKENESRRPQQWARLRLAVVEEYSRLVGDTLLGAAPVVARRFLDCEQCRRALALLPNRPLVVVVSSGLYDVVKERYGSLTPEKFVPIEVDIPEKGFREAAWLTVPGCDEAELELLRKEFGEVRRRDGRRQGEEGGEEEGEDDEGEDGAGEASRPARRSRFRWTSNQALATVIASMIAALGAVLPSLLSDSGSSDDSAPWVDVTGTCTAPGSRLQVASRGFTAGKPYTVSVTAPDGRPYDLSYGSSGTASAQGTLNTGWTCETRDVPGTYTITVTDSVTGVSARDTFQVARVG
ncbi:hypothetical protein [Streptomyces acidiscabies]|uniref:hypothetical protein n=1 Tax=Streptomyces acidiscabies TaxID=42234 RepID=UPI0009524012|nr:hypothetical protein [Streptomyces acidiscabies]